MESPKYIIDVLSKKYDKASFSCGIEALDNYLKTRANQDSKKKATVTYVLAREDSNKILGFYSLSSFSVLLADLPMDLILNLPKYPNVPCSLLGRLAVDKNYHHQGIGKYLLIDAINRVMKISEMMGISSVVVDAKDDNAIDFYKKFGFISFEDNKNRLFLLLSHKLNL